MYRLPVFSEHSVAVSQNNILKYEHVHHTDIMYRCFLLFLLPYLSETFTSITYDNLLNNKTYRTIIFEKLFVVQNNNTLRAVRSSLRLLYYTYYIIPILVTDTDRNIYPSQKNDFILR